MMREKSNAQELGRKRSRLLLVGTAVFTVCTIESPGKQNYPKTQVHPDQPLRTVTGTDRAKVLVFSPEGWVVV